MAKKKSQINARFKKADARLAALKICAFYYDDSTPVFLVKAIVDALADAGRELGLLEDGGWPSASSPAREITTDVELVTKIYEVAGPDYELKGAEA